MTDSSLSDFLLVPMDLQAAIVNDKVLAQVAFVDGQFDYTKVPLFQSPAPAPFDDGGTKPAAGIHLHWELPAAFRRGDKPDDSQPLDFPQVPNRWLVLRHWPGRSADDRRLKAWVVISDHHGPEGSNSFLDPTRTAPTPTRLGRVVELGGFSEPGNDLFLKAIAPGNVSFSAFRADARNVFSFCDDATANDGRTPLLSQPNQTCCLSYLVLGWFSKPEQDPLHGLPDIAAWAARLGDLGWAVDPAPLAIAGASPPQQAFGLSGCGDLRSRFAVGSQFSVAGSSANDGDYSVAAEPVYDPAADHLTIQTREPVPSALADGYILTTGVPGVWPSRSLAHGLLYNLAWQNDHLPERPNSSHAEIAANVKLAVGNSAIDALAALVVAEAKAVEHEGDDQAQADAAALEAFQTGLLNTLDQAGGRARLDRELRGKWFGSDDGGLKWSLVDNPAAVSASKPPPDQTQQAWLAQLNFYQQGLDREQRVLAAMRYDLYAAWWRTQSIDAGSYPVPLNIPARAWQRVAPLIAGQLPDRAAAVYRQQRNAAAWQAKVTALIATPPSYTAQDDTLVSIQTSDNPPQPVPPLLLKASKLPRFHEPVDPVILVSGLGASLDQADPARSGQQVLPCRFGGQAITAMAVDSSPIETRLLDSHVALPDPGKLPAGMAAVVDALVLESVLLDPDNAGLLARLSGQPTADIAAAIRAGTAYTGVAPRPFSAKPWQQAWVPLFLDWKLTFHPTVSAPVIEAGNGDQWRFDRSGWQFDGLDYQWRGGDVSTSTAGPDGLGYVIHAVDEAHAAFTIAGVGNLAFQFSTGAQFQVSDSADTYTVTGSTCDQAGNFTLTSSGGRVSASQVGASIRLQVLSGGAVTFGGRTFLTPKATFNFRARLQQYLEDHASSGEDAALADAAHLLDIIGGARYAIAAVDRAGRTLQVDSAVDLDHLFPAGSTFFIAESPHNDGSYQVAKTGFDESADRFSIVTQGPLPDGSPTGVVVPEPTHWDLLSQSLGGFTEQLLMRDLAPNQVPSGTVAGGAAQGQNFSDLVGDQDHALPDLTLGDSVQPALGRPTPYFFPVRGGFFALFDLALVDRFGQKIDLLFANGNDQAASPESAWQTFGPIRSRWMTPEADTRLTHADRLVKLPPRSGLGARLEFRLVSAPDGGDGPVPPGVDVDLCGDANPVAGWILPNHLDNGLLVYAADGGSLGELVLTRSANGLDAEWFPTPMAARPIVDPADPGSGIPNQYLRGFVAGILGLDPKRRGDAFANLLAAVDETLWTVDPLGGRSDQNLSALVGRPLALVRARLKLVTDGPPCHDQSTRYALPLAYPLDAVEQAGSRFGFAVSLENLAETGRFQPGATVEVTGSPHNDGVYHITQTGYDGSRFSVQVSEPIPDATVGGSLNVPPSIGGLTDTPFDLRLGRPDLFDDGLIGYFSGDDYGRCFCVHAPEDCQSAGYLRPIGSQGGNYLSIHYHAEASRGAPPHTPAPVADAQSQFLTLLLDPRGTVNATGGILPTEELDLPPRFYQEPLAKLALNFRTGPLLVDAEAIRMPRPSEQHGTWSWIQRNAPGSTPEAWEADPVSQANDQARFPSQPLQLRDGWLKLTGTDLED